MINVTFINEQTLYILLFKCNNSTIMVYNKEDSYVFMRTEGEMNWHPIHSVPIEIIQQLC